MARPNGKDRKWHYLRKLKGNACPSSLLFFDTETIPTPDPDEPKRQVHKLRLWCANYVRMSKGKIERDSLYSGTTIAEFWDMVSEKLENRRPLWLFSHNLGFDGTIIGLWRLLYDNTIELRQEEYITGISGSHLPVKSWSGFAVLDSPPLVINGRWQQTKKEIVLVDTMNYWRCPLADIGDEIGYPKMEMPPFSANDATWFAYCHRDVRIIKRAVVELIKLVQGERLGGLQYTSSSQSMCAYRAKFMEERSILVHGDKDALELERSAYYGGLAQQWYCGQVLKAADIKEQLTSNPHTCNPMESGPVYVLDVQSFYPSLMRDRQFPCALKGIIYGPSLQQMYDLASSYAVVARVKVNCSIVGYPTRIDGVTQYATGSFWTSLCGPELIRAMEAGEVKQCSSIASYESRNLFREWVDWWWGMRIHYKRTGQQIKAWYCKSIMNGLFGKFGQWSPRWLDRKDIAAEIPLGFFTHHDNATGETVQYRSVGWLTQHQIGKEEHQDSFPLISAYVTAYGREEILRLRTIAGFSNCFYSDTDSLHTNQRGFDNLNSAGEIIEGEIGKMSLKDQAESAMYRGPKDYSLGPRPIIAGIKRRATTEQSGVYKEQQWSSITTAIANPMQPVVYTRTVSIDRSKATLVGNVDQFGWITPTKLDN